MCEQNDNYLFPTFFCNSSIVFSNRSTFWTRRLYSARETNSPSVEVDNPLVETIGGVDTAGALACETFDF